MKSKIKKQFVLSLIITLFLISFTNIVISESLKNDKGSYEESLKTAAGEINIITPENKIYLKPMHGYYPGVNSFDNDKFGNEPTWFTDVDTNGGTVDVIEELDDHRTLVKLHDNNLTDNVFVRRILGAAPSFGTIEYWMRTDDATKLCGFQLHGGVSVETLIGLRTMNSMFQRFNGTDWINITSIGSNNWNHIRIDFECTTGTYLNLKQFKWKIYINGDQPFGAYPFINNRSYAINAVWYTDWLYNLADYNYYIDAIGFSWNNFYNIMDNMNEGLLLNFHAPSNLTWMGYSLNGGTNRTVLGNITIPKPGNGMQYIQVFGEDSLNTIYTSPLLSFEVDNPTWLFVPGMGGSKNGSTFRGNNSFWVLDMNNDGASDFVNYYGWSNMIGIPYYENATTRPEFTGIYGNSSILDMGNAIKNYIINEFHAGKIKDRIDLTGYSQGGVVVRSMIKQHYYEFIREGITINHIVILGSPCHGTWGFTRAYWIMSIEKKPYFNPNYAPMQMATGSEFMNNLNSGDETPYEIIYNTYAGHKLSNSVDRHYLFIENLDIPFMNRTYFAEPWMQIIINQTIEEVGIHYDGAVVYKSVSLEGAMSNRLYFGVNHGAIIANRIVFKDILAGLKTYHKSEINVEIPENKTYYNPSQGHFFASNSFTCDEINYKPAWFEVIGTSGGTVNVREEINNHKMVLDLHDTFNGSVNAHVRKLLSTNPTYGTVEFWMSSNDTSKICGFRIDDGSMLNEMVDIMTWSNLLWYDNGTDWNIICPVQDDSWYHIRIDFACATPGYEGLASYSWRIYVDGVQYGDYSFINNRNTASRLVWYTDWVLNMEDYHYYIDAIGISWDPNYSVGDNLKLGFLVDIQKTFVHDWMEYSLDGNSNIPILGDFLIPLPTEGSHSLQLFAQDWSGEQVESVILFFSKDTAPPDLLLFSPGPGDLFGINSPQFSLSINDTNLDSMWYTLNNGLTNISISGVSGQIDQTEWNNYINGTVGIIFYANNTLGTLEYIEITVRKDIINPNITIHNPLQTGVYGSTPPSYDISIEEPSGLDSVWFTFDGGTNNYTLSTLTGTFVTSLWSSIPDGQVTLRIYARDEAGNVGYTEVTFSKDTSEDPEGIPSYNIVIIIGVISIGYLLIRKKLSKNKTI